MTESFTLKTGGARRGVALLSLVKGPGQGQRFRLAESLLIGRSPEADFVIEHEQISRMHARLWQGEDGAYFIEDLSSRNGTFVGGARVERCRVEFGESIRLGSEVEFKLQGSDGLSDQLIEKQRYETLGRLGAGAAHDLNYLVTGIQANADALRALLGDKRLGDADLQDCLNELVIAASKADHFVRSMLEFAQAGRAQRTLVDLSALVEETLDLCTRRSAAASRSSSSTPRACSCWAIARS
ncbi:MAG: FHA domain-containing protein [Polyangiaceae bacterium]